MKKKNVRKGFTLVELLVVIAILAILAAVSVVGYTTFIKKAKDSNAAAELNQFVQYIKAEMILDGEETIDGVTFAYDEETNTLTITSTETDIDDAIHELEDMAEMEGTFAIENKTINNTAFTKLKYTTADGGSAVTDEWEHVILQQPTTPTPTT